MSVVSCCSSGSPVTVRTLSPIPVGLRHTHATIALRAGVHPKVVSERLGHASVAFTLDVYTDSLPDMQEPAASLIAALVLEP